MKSIKEAFNHSFEQVGYDKEPEFTIHGIGYQSKWGKDSMSYFLKDLESVEDHLCCQITEMEDGDEEKVDEIKELKGEVRDLEKENERLIGKVDELESELEELRNE